MDEQRIAAALRGVRVVVTGGAGYVGSAVAHRLARLGAHVVVLDSLVKGHTWAVRDLPLETLDVRDTDGLAKLFAREKVDAVCHLAALATIPESFADPALYRDVNHQGTLSVLTAMERAGVAVMAFASTCAIYAAPDRPGVPLHEGDPENPLSPYAEGKQWAEREIREFDARGAVRTSMFRFFNAAGADRETGIGEDHEPETHAIPRCVQWALGRSRFSVFGTDYPTRDGTCVRDYVHTDDLAWAHARALVALRAGDDRARGVFNLGSGTGTTVHELVERTCTLMNVAERPPTAPRRDGDAAMLLAEPVKARDVLGWVPKHDLDSILGDAIWWETTGRANVAR